MAKTKTRKVTTSSGKTSLVRSGSKAEARYMSEGASFSDDSSAIRAQKDVSKAATSARGATGSNSNTNVVGSSSSPTTDIIRDDVTGQSFSRSSSTDTYKPYTGPAVSASTQSTTTPSKKTDSTDTSYVKRYTAKDTYSPTPVLSVEKLQREKTKAAQSEINALHDYEKTLLEEQAIINNKDERSTSSVNTLSGLAGSTEANQTQQATTAKGQQANRQITDRIAVEVQGILSQIRKDAVTEARQSRLDARDDETAYLANQAIRRETAEKRIKVLAGAGTTLEGLWKTDRKSYEQLVDAVGGEKMLSAMLFDARPKDTLVGVPQLFGSQLFQAYQTPDGRTKYEALELPPGLDPVGIQSVEKTNNGIFIIKKDGTWSKVTGSEEIEDTDELLSVTEAQALGVPYGTTKSGAYGKTPSKPANATQQKALGFFERAESAQTLASLQEDRIAEMGLGDQFALETLPNWLQKGDNQSYRQAQRSFTEARLRQESGAAIPDSEYQNDARTYFAVPGDTAETIKQKKEARQIIVDNLKRSAGPAYRDAYGDEDYSSDETGEVMTGDERQRLIDEGFDPDDGSVSFKGVGGDTNLASLKQSLIAQESGGNYSAVGIPTAHGRALGKYQIIPKFHFDKIGLNPSSEADKRKFLTSPQLQDKVFAILVDELAAQYNGDPHKIAAAYYGGAGGASVVGTRAGDKPQAGGMPSINEYVRSVVSRA